MKTPSEIEARVQACLAKELERRLEVEVLPLRCRHNLRQPLDYRKTIFGEPNKAYNRISGGSEDGKALPVIQTIGLCGLGSDDPSTWSGTICEDPLDAQRCHANEGGFEPEQSPSEVYDQFVADVSKSDWLEVNLPEVASLLWVLGSQINHVRDDPPPRLEPPAPLPLWARLWIALRPPKTPPPKLPEPPADVAVYLPRPPDADRS